MKGFLLIVGVVMLILVGGVLTSTNSYKEDIVGTWVSIDGGVVHVFDDEGFMYTGSQKCTYTINQYELIMEIGEGIPFTYYFKNDKNILVLDIFNKGVQEEFIRESY